ncbi:calcium-activated chloride channel-domain-containing protein [Russula compacta]|nr:calcium-activated chloride channel-domain-containing protein [Russula compacta]
MRHDIDLVVVFRTGSPSTHISKQKARQEAQEAEDQYSRLLETLRNAGLYAVGRRGEHQGQLIVLVSCSGHQLHQLLQHVLHGLSTTCASDVDPSALKPSERLRLVHTYVTATSDDGGLGIHPDNDIWPRVESIMALHDPEYNNVWIRSVTKTIDVGHKQLDFIRCQFGEGVALYFGFLASYTHSLVFISFVGLVTHYFGHAYSILYSSLLFLWSVVFVEYWRIRERLYSVAWGSLGSVRVEAHRPSYIEGHPWWKRELKILVSVPIIALFASVLAVLLTAIFIFEAFVTTLYTGPGHDYISFAPTLIFTAIIPRFLAIYQTRAQRLTQWENHKHQSSFDASLTIKSFALSSVVAYLGLALSAFIYVPFGETVMNTVQQLITSNITSSPTLSSALNTTEKGSRAFFVSDMSAARAKLSRSRLEKEMFAYTVTNQATNFFLEVGLPFLTRAFTSVRSGKRRPSLSGASAGSSKKKRVGFEDEKNGVARDEREFLERVRREVSLPQYDLFEDYNEMVSQFGYVALWSTIWPLAPLMSLLNNVIEFPSDAFKIVTHFRHPLPQRTDTIGPWLDCLSFLAWLSALTNSALVYLFRPHAKLVNDGADAPAGMGRVEIERGRQGMHEVLGRALFIALAASHGYILLQAAVRHVLERALWYGSPEKARRDASARQVKERYLQSVEGAGAGGTQGLGIVAGVSRSSSSSAGVGVGANPEVAPFPPPLPPAAGKGPTPPPLVPPPGEFWQFDEGLDEIRKGIKEA